MRRGSKLRASGIPQSKLARYPRQTTMWTTSWSQMCGWSLAKCLGKKTHWKNMEKRSTFKILLVFKAFSSAFQKKMFVHVCARCGRSELLTWAFLQFTPVPLVWRPAFCEVFFLGGRGWRRQLIARQMERELACASRAFCESEMTRQRRHLEGIMGIHGNRCSFSY